VAHLEPIAAVLPSQRCVREACSGYPAEVPHGIDGDLEVRQSNLAIGAHSCLVIEERRYYLRDLPYAVIQRSRLLLEGATIEDQAMTAIVAQAMQNSRFVLPR
jgi:hypothetical protein